MTARIGGKKMKAALAWVVLDDNGLVCSTLGVVAMSTKYGAESLASEFGYRIARVRITEVRHAK